MITIINQNHEKWTKSLIKKNTRSVLHTDFTMITIIFQSFSNYFQFLHNHPIYSNSPIKNHLSFKISMVFPNQPPPPLSSREIHDVITTWRHFSPRSPQKPHFWSQSGTRSHLQIPEIVVIVLGIVRKSAWHISPQTRDVICCCQGDGRGKGRSGDPWNHRGGNLARQGEWLGNHGRLLLRLGGFYEGAGGGEENQKRENTGGKCEFSGKQRVKGEKVRFPRDFLIKTLIKSYLNRNPDQKSIWEIS